MRYRHGETEADAEAHAVPGVLQVLQAELLDDAAAMPAPALAPLMLTVAALSVSADGSAAPTADALAAAAEDAGAWTAMLQLLSHEGLREGVERCMVGTPLFAAVGAAVDTFGVHMHALPAADVDALLALLDGLVYHDAVLTWCASASPH